MGLKMIMRYLAVAAVLTFFVNANAAQAATIDSWATTTDNPVIDTAPTVTIDDTSNSNSLTFNISIPNTNGQLSGVWLGFDGSFDFEAADLMVLNGGPAITVFDDALPENNDIGNGRNLAGNFTSPINSKSEGLFDFGIGFGTNDNTRQIDLPFSFKLDDQGGTLGLDNLQYVGLRFQTVGTLGQDGPGNESEKLIGQPSVSPVPLPAAGWMLLAGVGGLAAMRRRKRT